MLKKENDCLSDSNDARVYGSAFQMLSNDKAALSTSAFHCQPRAIVIHINMSRAKPQLQIKWVFLKVELHFYEKIKG